MVQGLDGPRMRGVLRDILNGERRDLRDIPATELAVEPMTRDTDEDGDSTAKGDGKGKGGAKTRSEGKARSETKTRTDSSSEPARDPETDAPLRTAG
jgi:hypothetical protein